MKNLLRCNKNQHGAIMPMALSSTMFDLLNKISVHSIIAPISAAERDLAKQHLHQLRKINQQTKFDKTGIKDLFIFDRGYPSTELFVRFAKENKDFLARCSRNFCTEVVEILASGQTDVIIEIDISKKRKCAHAARSLQLLKICKIENCLWMDPRVAGQNPAPKDDTLHDGCHSRLWPLGLLTENPS